MAISLKSSQHLVQECWIRLGNCSLYHTYEEDEVPGAGGAMRIRRSSMSRARLLACVGVGTVLAVTACSSTATKAGGASSTSFSSVSSGTASGGIAAAKAFVQANLTPPTKILVTTPLPKAPPTGLSIVVIQGSNVEAAQQTADVQAAAKVLGWKVNVIATASTPEAYAAAMTNAIAIHPAAVLTSGFPAAVFGSSLTQMRSQGIAYVTNGTTDCTDTCDYQSNGVFADVEAPPNYAVEGKWLANWVAADSNGTAHSVLWDLSTFTVLNSQIDNYKSTLSAVCPNCHADIQNVAATAAGTTFPQQVVNYLQAHPDVNYMVLSAGLLASGLQSALDSAGLSNRVKIADGGGGPVNLQNIKSGGSEKVFVPAGDDGSLGWLMVDAVARFVLHVPATESEYATIPRYYLTKDNIGDPSQNIAAVSGYQNQFKQLWRVGG